MVGSIVSATSTGIEGISMGISKVKLAPIVKLQLFNYCKYSTAKINRKGKRMGRN